MTTKNLLKICQKKNIFVNIHNENHN